MVKRTFVVLLIALAVFAGCGPWKVTGGPYVSSQNNFATELPPGWVRVNTEDSLRMTRDGFPLQTIFIGRSRVDEYELKYTKKKLSGGMLPQEVAEVLIDNMASNPALASLEVKENRPAKISGVPAARIAVVFRNKDGLTIEALSYRFMQDEWLYTLSYTAPVRYYFDRDVKAFDDVVSRFRLLETP